jgi:pyruvate formate lyase activating enzyme
LQPAATLRVNAIQRFCLRDGPGIRTVVFVQGCPLRCWWCHNPEMQAADGPDARDWPVEELAEELRRDERYWRTSGGGVTVSGGEPLAQPEGLAGLLAELGRRGCHRAVETSGAASLPSVEMAHPHVDLWLWDIKATDEGKFRDATGGELGAAIDNLRWVLGRGGAPVTVRVPLIRGFNDGDEMERIASRLTSLPRPPAVEVLSGHDLGRRKRGSSAGVGAKVTPEQVEAARALLRAAGLKVLTTCET